MASGCELIQMLQDAVTEFDGFGFACQLEQVAAITDVDI